jgi:hypothetical protein
LTIDVIVVGVDIHGQRKMLVSSAPPSEVTMVSHVIDRAKTFEKVGTDDIFSLM